MSPVWPQPSVIGLGEGPVLEGPSQDSPAARPPPPRAAPFPLFLSLLAAHLEFLLEMGRGWILSEYPKTQK